METRLNTYFIVPRDSIATPIPLPEFAYDHEGTTLYKSMMDVASVPSRLLAANAIVDVRPSRVYTNDLTYTVNAVEKLFAPDDWSYDADGNIEVAIFIQTFHPSVYKDFVNAMHTIGYTKYSDDQMFDWDSMDKLLREAGV